MTLSLYKIFLHFKAILRESSILYNPPPTCNAYPITALLHADGAMYGPLPTPPFFKQYTIY